MALIVLLALAFLAVAFSYWFFSQVRSMTCMPGRSHAGPLRPLSAPEAELAVGLERHVRALADQVGVRHQSTPGTLEQSAAYIDRQLSDLDYLVQVQAYEVAGEVVKNLEVELRGNRFPEEIIVIGAHFDSVFNCAGADDNASGIAAMLELARLLRWLNPDRTVRFVAFTHEERPNGKNGTMGSQVYARRCRARNENIVAMLAMETMAYYSDEPGSQAYPPPFSFIYPSTGNFIGFIGDRASRQLVHRCIASFRRHTDFPSEGIASWRWVPGVGSSDHEPFWLEGYPALMVTDTAPFRNPYYHTTGDLPETLDFARFARVVAGVSRVVMELASD
jgi:hypothetical protein